MPERSGRRVLLDENVDRRLKALFDADLEISTVQEQQWEGFTNGELLREAESEFEVLVTMDRNLPHQQNLQDFRIAIVVIASMSNALRDVTPLMNKVNRAVKTGNAGQATVVS